MSENKSAIIKYTRSHEWISFTGELATCGITEHAQEILGEAVDIELPAPGSRVKVGTKLVSLESSKAVTDIYAPLEGEITAVNQELKQKPALINTDPMGRGWLFQFRCDQVPDLSAFMDETAYLDFIKDA